MEAGSLKRRSTVLSDREDTERSVISPLQLYILIMLTVITISQASQDHNNLSRVKWLGPRGIGQRGTDTTMSYMRALLALAVLCAPTSSLCFRLYESEFNFLCNNEVLSGAKKSANSSAADTREKRTFPASRYKYLTQAQLRGKMYQNSAKSDRRSKFTLSLDVPTNIMNILFNIAKAKNLRAKAADNARLMAQIGKK
ncbi:hypothetical protein AAFF_G00167760 [Aldrovandia affinis]|uniref:Corticotropin-releasing factor domain-containing protein n=1 Tax=Aldrovandia affinis TaxID=143900 RepID=A0AAD7RM97_9TELE|nr:hypothetical protein AAFF_G00167760 [Aldrovandia affinis]